MTSQVTTEKQGMAMLGNRTLVGTLMLPEAQALGSPARRRWAFWRRRQTSGIDGEARFVKVMNDAVFERNIEQKRREMDIAMVDMPFTAFDPSGRW